MDTVAIVDRLADLDRIVRETGGVAVAFSGGIDSALVLAAAARVLGSRALAVTAVSPALPPGDLDDARRVAAEVGVRHRVVATRETESASYLANGIDRCYHCKTELYSVLQRVAEEEELPVVASGTNVDDLSDYRPGLRAAGEAGVLHPLVEAGFTKADVRAAAAEIGLSLADKPASACLSSRIAFGVRITVDELTKVGRAEKLLKDLGFRQVRVRVHGDLVRVEVDPDELSRLADSGTRQHITTELKSLGYRYVTLDLEGFRSGSMNPESDRP